MKELEEVFLLLKKWETTVSVVWWTCPVTNDQPSIAAIEFNTEIMIKCSKIAQNSTSALQLWSKRATALTQKQHDTAKSDSRSGRRVRRKLTCQPRCLILIHWNQSQRAERKLLQQVSINGQNPKHQGPSVPKCVMDYTFHTNIINIKVHTESTSNLITEQWQIQCWLAQETQTIWFPVLKVLKCKTGAQSCVGSLTAVDILCNKCMLLNRIFIYKTFAQYIS